MAIPKQLWKKFLEDHCYPNSPSYKEAHEWRDSGLTWEQVLETWDKGDDLLWAAQEMGLLSGEDCIKIACTCVDRCGCLAPDVLEISGAACKGDMTAAAFGAACIQGNAEGIPDKEISLPDKEPIMPVAEAKVYPGAEKARYAATLLLDDSRPYMTMTHAVQARKQHAIGIWSQAKCDCAARGELAEHEAAINRVEVAEHLAHADIVRAFFGGLK